MIVDAHAHYVPEALMTELRDRRGDFPSVEMVEEKGSLSFSFAGGPRTRPVAGFLRDRAKRVDWMDAQGIDLQVVAGWLDMFGNQLPSEEGAAWAATINRHMAEAVAASGDRFRALATLPTQDGARAGAMLREARAQGFAGAMIGTQPLGRGGVLDDPDLDPFWQAAHETRSVVSIHPVFDAGDDRVHDYGMANAVGRVTDTLIAVSRLIYAGHVTRYPEARFLVGIGGAALPWILGRLRRNAALDDALGDPEAALRGLHYDTLLHDPAPLRLLVDLVGADRVMVGSDMPFPIGDPEPLAVLDAAGISGEARAAIEGGTARRLLDI